MEKGQLIEMFSELINSDNPQNEINKFCRRYLVDKINDSGIKDVYVMDVLLDFAKQFSVTLDFDTIESEPSEMQNGIGKKRVYGLYGVAGVAGVATIASDSAVVRSLASAIMVAASVFATKELYNCKYAISTPIVTHVVKTTPEEIYIQLCHYEKNIDKLIGFNSLDSYDKGILAWMQQQYSESDDMSYKKSIVVVLRQSGYEFVDYSEELASFFDSSSANVEKATTTFPAIKSNHSNYIVQRGHVVFPMN